ncbi:MAG: hypothetical protein IPM25_13290 [Chloracidobacterium sp.]|nr:hypothetical protein [Chloracidobacterium sp.]
MILSLGLVSIFITTVSSRNRMVYVEDRSPQEAGISVTNGDERIPATTGQPTERSIWKVYVRTSPCSGRFDWVSVALQNPTGRGGSGIWYTADIILTGTPMRCVREGSRCTKAEAEAEAVVVRGQPKFRDYCCKEYSVWKQQQTGKWTIVVGKFGNPGPGWFFEDGPMCCEEAEEITGLTGACSGSTGRGTGGGAAAGGWGPYQKGSVNQGDGQTLTFYRGTTPEQCQADCDKNPRCAGFTLIHAGAFNPNDPPMCYLIAEARKITPSPCCTTALKTKGENGVTSSDIDLSGNWRASIVESNTGNNFTYDLVLNRASAGKWTGMLTLTSSPNASYGFTAAATLESLGGGNMRITYFAKGRDQVGTGTFTRDAIFFGGSQNSVKFVRR